jgi:hypothetical protein
METQTFSLDVQLPSIEEFTEHFPQYGKFAKNEGRFLFDAIISTESFIRAKIATELGLPAVAGIARLSYQAVAEQSSLEWRGFLKQFIGAAVCVLMEANGFEKTGQKKSVSAPNFTKAEFYRLLDQ